MLFVTLYWLIVFIAIYTIGFAFTSVISRYLREEKAFSIDNYFFSGFIFVAIVANYSSIFFPLNNWALLAVFLLSSFLTLIHRKSFLNHLESSLNLIKRTDFKEKSIVLLLLFFLLIIASGEILVYDTWLYHSQNIQWIKKYPVIPGLANLQPQLGFNNMFFVLNALFTIDYPFFLEDYDLLIYPLNGVVSIVVLLKLGTFLKLELKEKNWWRSFFYTTILGFCFLLFPRMINSPAPDLVCGILVIYILLIVEKENIEYSLYQSILTSGLIVSCITFKLSTLCLSLLVPFYLFNNFTHKKIYGVSVVGLIVLIPFLIRNYYLSGYLIFPFPEIDLFETDWKIAFDRVVFERLVIKSWAKIPSMAPSAVNNLELSEWLGIWWSKKDLIWKPILLTTVLSILSIPIFIFKRKIKMALVVGIIILNILFWFLNAPDPRFVFGFLFSGTALTLTSFLLLGDIWKKLNSHLILSFFGVFVIMSLYYHRIELQNPLQSPICWILPQEQPKAEVTKMTTNFTYNKPEPNSFCYNSPIPCATRPLGHVILRDSLIKNGFKVIKD